MHHTSPTLAQCQQPLESLQFANAVHIGKGAKDRCPMQDALLNGPACSLQDILSGVAGLVFPGEFQAFAEGVVLVGSHLLLEEALVEVDMSVHVGRHDQVPGSIHFCGCLPGEMFSHFCNTTIGDSHIPGSLASL